MRWDKKTMATNQALHICLDLHAGCQDDFVVCIIGCNTNLGLKPSLQYSRQSRVQHNVT